MVQERVEPDLSCPQLHHQGRLWFPEAFMEARDLPPQAWLQSSAVHPLAAGCPTFAPLVQLELTECLLHPSEQRGPCGPSLLDVAPLCRELFPYLCLHPAFQLGERRGVSLFLPSSPRARLSSGEYRFHPFLYLLPRLRERASRYSLGCRRLQV